MYYIVQVMESGDETILAKVDDKQKAVKTARQKWLSISQEEKKHCDLEVRRYIDDIESDTCQCYDYTVTRWRVYEYGMRHRGFSIGCQPMDGLLERRDSTLEEYYDFLRYDRMLTANELRDYELDFIREVTGTRNTLSYETYDKKNRKRYSVAFMVKSDADIIEKLESVQNKNDYIRDLIRRDIEEKKGNDI